MAGTSVAESTVRLAAAGDEAAFARLVTEHHASMARVAFFIADDIDVATDAAQAAWAIAWRKLRSLRDPERVGPWLVSIAANESRRLVRQRRRRNTIENAIAPDAGSGGDPTEAIGVLDLRRALGRLTPEERALLSLRYAGGFDSTQIGVLTGRTASGVRSRLARLLERLRVELDHA